MLKLWFNKLSSISNSSETKSKSAIETFISIQLEDATKAHTLGLHNKCVLYFGLRNNGVCTYLW